MIDHEIPAVTVRATFDDSIAAEIACALLSDGSLRPEEPEPAGLRTWVVELRGLTPTLARRAEVVLRSARANQMRIVPEDARIEHVCADGRTSRERIAVSAPLHEQRPALSPG